MNTSRHIGGIVALTALLLCSCSVSHHVNGFYELSDYPDNTIIGKPIATVSDFERVSIQTVGDMNVIEGRLNPDARIIFANATERLTGHRIGFVFNDSIITAPQINSRIDSGNFQIISPDTALTRKIYIDITSAGTTK